MRLNKLAVLCVVCVAVACAALPAATAATGDGHPQPDAVQTGIRPTISVGYEHACALNAVGKVACWGRGRAADVPFNLGPVTEIAAGFDHTCAITINATPVCWGEDDAGQTSVPMGAFYLGVRSITAGFRYTCAIRSDEYRTCWGDSRPEVGLPPGLSGLSAGRVEMCGIDADQLADCSVFRVPRDVGPVSTVSAGDTHACALTVAGRARCWGHDGYGETVVPADLGPVTSVAAGVDVSCASRLDGVVRCWGRNDDGRFPPRANLMASSVALGGRQMCGFTKPLGIVECWGGRLPLPTFSLNGSGRLSVFAGSGFSAPLHGDPGDTYTLAPESFPGFLVIDPGEATLRGILYLPNIYFVLPYTYIVTVIVDGLFASHLSISVLRDTSLLSTPPPRSGDDTAVFEFAGGDVGDATTYQCALDGAPPTPCASPVELTDLASGAHTYAVAASHNGVTDPTPSTYSWTVDAIATPVAASPSFTG